MPSVVNVVSWRIPRQHHDDMLKLIAGGIGHRTGNDYQRQHPLEFYYSRTRTFYRVDEETDTEEWFFMDEYDDAELYHKMAEEWTGPEESRHPLAAEVVAENHPKWASLTTSGLLPVMKLYEVLEPLTLEFEPWARRAAALQRETDESWRLRGLG
jgi:hypothetical protein